MIEGARTEHRRRAVAVQREEPDSGDTIVMNVSPHVQLMCWTKSGNRREERWKRTNVPHRKWNDSNPGAAVESINLKLFGNQLTQFGFLNSPMHEEELAPLLRSEER